MMKHMVGLAATALLMASASADAQGKQDFTLGNRTGYTIEEVYVAPSKSDEWEEDVMGRDVLDNGESVVINFPRKEKTCRYDVRVVFDDGDDAEWFNFDLCEVSSITLFYNRKTGETTAQYE